ncbi:MAG: aminoglycoside resistance protein, partial [Cellulomonadaceae bacterium]|nr:aminoglycoside resistance protein [Cellulomonadaceae bacterium]
MRLPATLLGLADHGPTWSGWLDALPRLADDQLDRWELVQDGEPTHGECALVVPVRTADGAPAVVKLTWPHPEAEHEHLALQHWHGDGSVLLLRADPHRAALLLERLSTTDLSTVDDVEACTVVGDLLRRLHRPALPQLTLLSTSVADWSARLASLPRSAPLPRRLVDLAASLGRTFADDPATDGVLVHTDAHYANVLAGSREPWLVIDPKPLSGDPHYEP